MDPNGQREFRAAGLRRETTIYCVCSVYSDYFVEMLPSAGNSRSMKTQDKYRIDPSLVSHKDLDGLFEVLNRPSHPTLVSEQGMRTEIPTPVFEILLTIVEMMRQGKTVALLPEDEPFTTQAAANFLGVSRQFLVNLLDEGEIPFHRVGSHRRVSYKDLVAYDKARRVDRRDRLKSLTRKLVQEGVYDAEVKEGDAG